MSAVALTALIVQQLRSTSPIVDLRLFKDRTYAVGVFLMTVLGFVLYGSLVLLPVMLQTLFGLLVAIRRARRWCRAASGRW